MGLLKFIGLHLLSVAVIAAISFAIYRAVRVRPVEDIETETAKRDRRICFVAKVLAFTAAVLPTVFQAMRVRDMGTLASVLFPYAFLSFFIAPLLIASGLIFTFYLRLKRGKEVQGASPKPSCFVFVVSVPLWLFSRYTFTLLPLFIGNVVMESGIHRTWMDGCVDWLLRANL
jgi:hypothetical protein